MKQIQGYRMGHVPYFNYPSRIDSIKQSANFLYFCLFFVYLEDYSTNAVSNGSCKIYQETLIRQRECAHAIVIAYFR